MALLIICLSCAFSVLISSCYIIHHSSEVLHQRGVLGLICSLFLVYVTYRNTSFVSGYSAALVLSRLVWLNIYYSSATTVIVVAAYS